MLRHVSVLAPAGIAATRCTSAFAASSTVASANRSASGASLARISTCAARGREQGLDSVRVVPQQNRGAGEGRATQLPRASQ